jgi:uncharacterized RDD family membrane protein YckC
MTLRRLVPPVAQSLRRDNGRVYPDEQVVTGEAVALELRLAGVGSRGIAALIDIVIGTFVEIVLIIALLFLGAGTNAATLDTALIVVVVGCTLGYPVGFETLWRGRTPGKALMGLRVVRDDGGPIRFRHAFVRGLVGVFIDKTGITQGLGALIPMVAGSRKKRLGDLAAGTIVLQERVPGRVDVPVAMPPQLAGWAASLDLAGLDDALALRIRQYLGRAHQFTPHARSLHEHHLANEVVAKVGLPPPHTPGWAVLSAVLAERRRRAFASQQPVWVLPPVTAAAPTPGSSLPPPPASGRPDAVLAPPTHDGYAPPA